MDIKTALNQTMQTYQLSARELARNADLDDSLISRFRNGHHAMRTDKLEQLIKALPPDARFYFLSLVSSDLE